MPAGVMMPRAPFGIRLLPLVAFVLLVLGVAASAGFEADLVARSTKGAGAEMTGPLVAFLQEQSAVGTGLATPGFSLDAPSLRIETDSSDPAIHGGVAAHRPNPQTTTAFYQDAKVQGVSNRAGYRFNVFSTSPFDPARIAVTSSCAAAEPSERGILRRGPVVDVTSRPTTSRDTGRALEWSCLAGASLRVTGDFWVSLWSWDAHLISQGTLKELHTGPQRSGIPPEGFPDASGAVSRDQEAYLYVANGTLTVPLLAQGYILLTGAQTTLSAKSIQLSGSSGALTVQETRFDLQDSTLQFTGEPRIVLESLSPNQPFPVHVAGRPDSVVVDGRVFSLAPSDSTLSLRWGAIGFGFALTVLLGLFAMQRWRLRGLSSRPFAPDRDLAEDFDFDDEVSEDSPLSWNPGHSAPRDPHHVGLKRP